MTLEYPANRKLRPVEQQPMSACRTVKALVLLSSMLSALALSCGTGAQRVR